MINVSNGAATLVLSSGDGTLTIQDSDNITSLSLVVLSGTLTVLGPGKFRGEDSEAVTLPEGTVMAISGQGGGNLAGWQFTASASAGFLLNR